MLRLGLRAPLVARKNSSKPVRLPLVFVSHNARDYSVTGTLSKMAATTTRWGICGTSRIAHDFIVAMKTLPEKDHKVVAVSSRSVERAAEFADRHNIEKAYGSYEELARDNDIEVVYVGTIHPEHAALCKLALNHGKHVLCEKPMTMNLKDTKELFELAKEKGLFIMEVGYRDRAGGGVLWIFLGRGVPLGL